MATDDVIRAAGVVLLREEAGTQHVLIVHRPLREDWSLPKGKIDAGEHLIAAAIRECDEETGFTPVLGSPLPTQSYSVLSRPKVVNYWSARVRTEDGFAPDDEIDEIKWVQVTEAEEHLTYPSDARLVSLAAERPETVPLIILRHTQAMKRSDFKGDHDHERPLSGRGRSQSKALIPLLDAFGTEALHASTSRRCTETLRRFAKHIDGRVIEEPDLTEEAFLEDSSRAATRVRELAAEQVPLVLCSHRPVLPTILESLAETLVLDADDPQWGRMWDSKLPPGGFIVIHRAFAPDGHVRVVGVERHTLSGA
jgi:8-oxo-dGTP pyrophosphatase MutT (NUDIX family)/phosphohistidine phosphatase SixA